MGSLGKQLWKDECMLISARLDERANEEEQIQDLPFLIKESKALLGHWAFAKAGGDPYAIFQYEKFFLIVQMYVGLLENKNNQHQVFVNTAKQFDTLARRFGF
jgi:hypothetical protein